MEENKDTILGNTPSLMTKPCFDALREYFVLCDAIGTFVHGNEKVASMASALSADHESKEKVFYALDEKVEKEAARLAKLGYDADSRAEAKSIMQNVSELFKDVKGHVAQTKATSAKINRLRIGIVAQSDLFLFFEMVLCRSVDNLLAFITELMKHAYKHKPELLKAFDNSIQLKEILEFQTIDEVTGYLIDGVVHSLAYKSFGELVKELNKKHGLDLSVAGRTEQITLLIEARNLLVHNRGIVNRRASLKAQYLKRFIGTRVPLPLEFIADGLVDTARFIVDAEKCAVAKFGLPQECSKSELIDG